MAKLTVIDGNSLLFRAFFATSYGGADIMRASDGTPTNAIFAFSSMINKIVSGVKEGDCLFVAFDTGHQTFRHEALDTYKANRKPVAPELIQQFPLAREFLDAMGIYQFEEDGYEGDDIAGTIAKKAASEGYDVNIYTSDRDFLQLIDNKISINIIRKGLSDVVVMTPDVVKETYGFEPKQIIDYKGLRGDSSDNLPGIPGVGDKTAVKLIQEYGSFDNIIAHVDELKGKLKENIINNQETGRLSRDLAIIQTDIDLPFSIEDTVYHGYDFKKINTFCEKLELKSFMNRVSPKWKKDDVSDELNVVTITSVKDYPEPKEIGIAIDLEGDDYSRNDVFGIALNMDSMHLYISIEDAMKDENLKSYLKNPEIAKYAYDYKAIKVALHRYNIEIEGIVFDLLIAAYLIDSSLKNDPDSVMHSFGLDLPNNKDESSLLAQGDPQRASQLALYTRLLCSRVRKDLEKIDAYKLYTDLEIPLITTLADMEIEGFPINEEILNSFGDGFKEKEAEIAEKIYEAAGEKFNIASPKQVGEILFDKLGLPNKKKGSTSIEVLKELVNYHPIVELIIEHRKYAKLISTYIEGLKPHIFPDGKIRAKFNQAQTTTGRLSSSEPNLQNISIRDEEGKMIRKAFRYPNNEYQILSLDYSQIELRILASLSNCELLKEVFNNHEDIHAATAKRVFKLKGEPTENERRKAKAVNFGIIYGISDWGLAEQLDIYPNQAKQIINDFYQTFPEVNDFFLNIVNEAMDNGYVSTLMGRRRYLRELHDRNYQTREFAKRAAMNAPIQGSAADLIKIAMIKVDRMLKENGYKTRIISQIHDELIFKVPNEEKEVVYTKIKDIMEHALELDVALEVDGGFGDDWYSAK